MANSTILRHAANQSAELNVQGGKPSNHTKIYHMRSRSNLTNAEHHAMSKNHILLANKIGELPHHYFTVEHAHLIEEYNKHVNNGKTVIARMAQDNFKQINSLQ